MVREGAQQRLVALVQVEQVAAYHPVPWRCCLPRDRHLHLTGCRPVQSARATAREASGARVGAGVLPGELVTLDAQRALGRARRAEGLLVAHHVATEQHGGPTPVRGGHVGSELCEPQRKPACARSKLQDAKLAPRAALSAAACCAATALIDRCKHGGLQRTGRLPDPAVALVAPGDALTALCDGQLLSQPDVLVHVRGGGGESHAVRKECIGEAKHADAPERKV